MADCPRPIQICGPQTISAGSEADCPDWEICLPFGARLYQQDGCVRYVPGEPPEDGVYGLITFENGCITAVAENPVSKYQSDACAPVPCPCSEDSDTSSSDFCDASTTTGNLYSCDSSGKPLVKAYINGGDNVSVTGSGTLSDPFVITVDVDTGGVTSLISTTDAITVTAYIGDIEIAHKTGWNERTINGMSFDNYGHLIDYSETSTTTQIIGVVGSNGVAAETNSEGIVTVTLEDPANKLIGNYLLGGYTVELDTWNRVYDISRTIIMTEGTYALGAYDVGINAYGSITDIAETNSAGNLLHALIEGDGESTTLTINFTLRFSTYLIVELECAATSSDWGENLTFRLNGSTLSDKLVLVSSGSSTYPTKVRACPGGIYAASSHTLVITTTDVFPDDNICVSIRSVGAFNSAELSGASSST